MEILTWSWLWLFVVWFADTAVCSCRIPPESPVIPPRLRCYGWQVSFVKNYWRPVPWSRYVWLPRCISSGANIPWLSYHSLETLHCILHCIPEAGSLLISRKVVETPMVSLSHALLKASSGKTSRAVMRELTLRRDGLRVTIYRHFPFMNYGH